MTVAFRSRVSKVTFLALWLGLVALFATSSAVDDDDCGHRRLYEVSGNSTHRRLVEFTIDMTSGDAFKSSIRAARDAMNAPNVRTLSTKTARFCYATAGWTMQIQLRGEKTASIPMDNNLYLLIKDFPIDYPKDPQSGSVIKWDLPTFTRVVTTQDITTARAKGIYCFPYIIAEAIRFDWPMNRIATVLDSEDDGAMGFYIPTDQLVKTWKDVGKPLGVQESVTQRYLSEANFQQKWIPEFFQGPATYDDVADDA